MQRPFCRSNSSRRLVDFSRKKNGGFSVRKGIYPKGPKPFRRRNGCNFTWMVWVRQKVFFPECVLHTSERKHKNTPFAEVLSRWLHDFKKLYLESSIKLFSYDSAYRLIDVFFKPNLKVEYGCFFEKFRHQQLLLMEEIRLTSWGLVVYHIIYKVLHIPGGAGFLPSTVCEMKAVLLQYKIFAPFESFWTQDSSAAAIAADFAAEYVPWRLFMIETQCIGV